MTRTPAILAAAALGLLALAPAPAAAQGQGPCTHQGRQVVCPPGLPPGSSSVEFVPGGTNWRNSQTGAIVFVGSTTFPPFVAAPTPTGPGGPTPTTQPGPTVTSPTGDARTQLALVLPSEPGVTERPIKGYRALEAIIIQLFVLGEEYRDLTIRELEDEYRDQWYFGRGFFLLPIALGPAVDQADADQAPAVFTPGGAPVDEVM